MDTFIFRDLIFYRVSLAKCASFLLKGREELEESRSDMTAEASKWLSTERRAPDMVAIP